MIKAKAFGNTLSRMFPLIVGVLVVSAVIIAAKRYQEGQDKEVISAYRSGYFHACETCGERLDGASEKTILFHSSGGCK